MAGSREFEKHLFISYAHIDNLPLTREQQGWVSRFHVALDAMLSMRIGGPARIWRDQKLAGNDIFADEILAQFSKTALLISVLTPRYVASDWCAREVREFCKAAEQSGGVVVDRKLRVIKVIKTPVDDDHLLPEVLRDVLGYQFTSSMPSRRRWSWIPRTVRISSRSSTSSSPSWPGTSRNN